MLAVITQQGSGIGPNLILTRREPNPDRSRPNRRKTINRLLSGRRLNRLPAGTCPGQSRRPESNPEPADDKK
jgi:hypothetical protein